MMAGELEFEDIFYGESEILYPGTAHAMFVAFVLLVTVILTNLLVGLAVSDIQGLQASAGLDRLSRQTELVSRLESLFFSKLLRKAPRGFIVLCQRSALLRTSRYRLQFCIRPNDPRDTRLTRDIVVSIYKLVAERRDRNQSIRRKKRELNLSYLSHTRGESLKEVQIRNRATYMASPRSVSDNMTVGNRQTIGTAVTNPLDFDKNLETIKVQMLTLNTKVQELQNSFAGKLEQVGIQIALLRDAITEQNANIDDINKI